MHSLSMLCLSLNISLTAPCQGERKQGHGTDETEAVNRHRYLTCVHVYLSRIELLIKSSDGTNKLIQVANLIAIEQADLIPQIQLMFGRTSQDVISVLLDL